MILQPTKTPATMYDALFEEHDSEVATEREPSRALWDILAELEEKS